MARIKINQPLVHQLPMRYLLIVPVLLTVSTALLLAMHGGVDAPLLYSQCHSKARLPILSKIPGLGAPACFLVSLFMYAGASFRGIAQLGVILSFISALLTICYVEAARKCNLRSWTIRYPIFTWLTFNLVGGSLVWNFWVLPAFLQRSKDVRVERVKEEALEGGQANGAMEDHERITLGRSFTTTTEVWAIPLSVAIGFVAPSALMLVFTDVPFVAAWLVFPLWVAVVHWVVKFVASGLVRDNGPHYLESHLWSWALVYALPFIASLLTHTLFIWDLLFCKNNSRDMTRMALGLIGIDFTSVAVTVLYWVLTEAGIMPAVLLVVLTVFIGPGAALILTWLARERAICAYAIWDEQEVSDESDGDDSTVHEYTPLIR